jgi:hypothetical protein
LSQKILPSLKHLLYLEAIARIHYSDFGCGFGFYPSPGVIKTATDMLGVNVIDSLTHQPVVNLKIRNNRGTGPFRNRYGISDVVTVSVRNKDLVRPDLIGSDGGQGVIRYKWINQQFGAVSIGKQA